MSLEDMGVLLDILGNDTRRRILQLLADEPRYFIQLSKDLGVSQQAVLKHLDLLEKYGFISSYSGNSEYAVEFFFHDIPQKDVGTLPVQEKRLRSLQKEVSQLERESNPIARLNASDNLLRKISLELNRLAETEIALLRLKQRITKVAHEDIRRSFEDDLQRQILYATVGGAKQLDVEQLSAMLDTREKEISEALAIVRDKLSAGRVPRV
jgi:ArsR family transcriptional regulator